MTESKTQLLRTQAICKRYDVVPRTVDRWVQTGILPKPMVINHIRYWDANEIDRRDRKRMAEANTPASETAA